MNRPDHTNDKDSQQLYAYYNTLIDTISDKHYQIYNLEKEIDGYRITLEDAEEITKKINNINKLKQEIESLNTKINNFTTNAHTLFEEGGKTRRKRKNKKTKKGKSIKNRKKSIKNRKKSIRRR